MRAQLIGVGSLVAIMAALSGTAHAQAPFDVIPAISTATAKPISSFGIR
jgi:hypothetical protein